MTISAEGRLAAIFAVFALMFGFGCRSSAYEEYAFGEPVVLREDLNVLPEGLATARIALDDSRKELELARLRSEWLVGEQRVAKARLAVAEARERENSLAVQIARFKGLEAKLPGGEVPVAPETMSRWEGKLREYAAETARRDARVRLILRDVNSLRQKAADAGIAHVPVGEPPGKGDEP